jgi:hypothetical protein
MKVCSQCGITATHKFFAERRTPSGKLVDNIQPVMGFGMKDLLKHNRNRFICEPCFPEAKMKLEQMGFTVKPMEEL